MVWAAGRVPSATALAVFKALFNRTKDWADVEAMIEMDAIDVAEAGAWIERVVGLEDPMLRRTASLVA
jgi:hypothetical protein